MVAGLKMIYDPKNDAITDRWKGFFRILKRKDFIRPLKLISVEMYVELDRRFSTQSDPKGKKWAAIGSLTDAGANKSAYAKFKKASGKAKILVFEGIFRKSFISKSGSRSIFKLTRTQVSIGSNAPQAKALHFGFAKRNIPARGIVGVTKKFESTIVVPIFKAFLQEGWNG